MQLLAGLELVNLEPWTQLTHMIYWQHNMCTKSILEMFTNIDFIQIQILLNPKLLK
jgi:hypothetical protein